MKEKIVEHSIVLRVWSIAWLTHSVVWARSWARSHGPGASGNLVIAMREHNKESKRWRRRSVRKRRDHVTASDAVWGLAARLATCILGGSRDIGQAVARCRRKSYKGDSLASRKPLLRVESWQGS